jgi:hypothetical protein
MPLTDPLLAGGQVVLGAIDDARNGDQQVAFANAELRSPAVGTQPGFTDLTAGASRSMVKLYGYDPVAHAAIAEPVLFMTGTDYCTRFKVKPSAGICQNEWTTVDSHLKVTVPVTVRPKLTTTEDPKGEVDCTGSMTSGGTCPTTATAFVKWLKDSTSTDLVVVTTEDGHITRMAQEFTP